MWCLLLVPSSLVLSSGLHTDMIASVGISEDFTHLPVNRKPLTICLLFFVFEITLRHESRTRAVKSCDPVSRVPPSALDYQTFTHIQHSGKEAARRCIQKLSTMAILVSRLDAWNGTQCCGSWTYNNLLFPPPSLEIRHFGLQDVSVMGVSITVFPPLVWRGTGGSSSLELCGVPLPCFFLKPAVGCGLVLYWSLSAMLH